MPQKPPEGAARQLKPGYCLQNAATACGKGAARDLEAGYCLTSLSEATRKALGKRPECRKSLRRRRREAVEARLLPPECSKSLWQGRREGFGGRLLPNVAFWSRLEKLLESAQNAAKASRRRREAVEARLLPPEWSKSLWQGRRDGFGGRLLPNVAFWSH